MIVMRIMREAREAKENNEGEVEDREAIKRSPPLEM